MEGLVWHCEDGTLIKVRAVWPERDDAVPPAFRCSGAATLQVHRHHLGLRWPDGATRLGDSPLVVRVGAALDEHGGSEDLFACFSRINGQIFSRLRDIDFDP